MNTASTLLAASVAPSTARQYQRVWESFCSFSRGLGFTPLPSSPSTIALFISHLVSPPHPSAPSTVHSAISSVSYIHKLNNQPDPTASFLVRKILRGVSKLRPTNDTRIPITIPILQSLIQSLHSVCSPYDLVLYSSMYVTMFLSFLRLGEVTDSPHNIPFSQVLVSPNSVTITLSTFKHHQGKPPVTISIPQSPSSPLCPVLLLTRYIHVRGSRPGPFFSKQNGQPVLPEEFRRTLSRAKSVSNQSSARITPHSFRIGAATHAASKGYTSQQIQAMGRWKSSAFVKYIRIPALDAPGH